jgi:hemolysin D
MRNRAPSQNPGCVRLSSLEQQARIRREAKDIQFGSTLVWMQAEQQLVGQLRELPVKAAKQAEAASAALQRQHAQTGTEYEKTVLGDPTKAEQAASQASEGLRKDERRVALQIARAPIDGTVRELAAHTIGGVVTRAQALLMVVPDAPGLLVEAQVDNADAGFLDEGQDVEVKVDTFTFARHGPLHRHVLDVSRDSLASVAPLPPAPRHQDQADKPGAPAKEKSAGYTAHIALDRTSLFIDGHDQTLEPGMAVTAEIKTGRCRVISYLLSSL